MLLETVFIFRHILLLSRWFAFQPKSCFVTKTNYGDVVLPYSPCEWWFIESCSHCCQQIIKYAPDKMSVISTGWKAISSEHVKCHWSGSIWTFPWQMSLCLLAATALESWSWAKYECYISLLNLPSGSIIHSLTRKCYILYVTFSFKIWRKMWHM